MQLLKEELSRKEVAAQRRVERVQRECQAIRNKMKSHICDKQKIENELEQLKSDLILTGYRITPFPPFSSLSRLPPSFPFSPPSFPSSPPSPMQRAAKDQ